MNVFFETEHLVVRELEPEDTVRLYENHAEDDPYGNGMVVYKWTAR